jgi:hypothetical protein
MGVIIMRVSEEQRTRWFAEAHRRGVTLTDLVKTAVEKSITELANATAAAVSGIVDS